MLDFDGLLDDERYFRKLAVILWFKYGSEFITSLHPNEIEDLMILALEVFNE